MRFQRHSVMYQNNYYHLLTMNLNKYVRYVSNTTSTSVLSVLNLLKPVHTIATAFSCHQLTSVTGYLKYPSTKHR